MAAHVLARGTRPEPPSFLTPSKWYWLDDPPSFLTQVLMNDVSGLLVNKVHAEVQKKVCHG